MPNTIDKRDEAKVREIDAGLKNKFRWDWFDRKVTITPVDGKHEPVSVTIGDFVKKLDVAGKALCTVCDDVVNYGSRGLKAFECHALTAKHRKQTFLLKSNYSLSSAFQSKTSSMPPNSDPAQVPTTVPAPSTSSSVKPIVPISDRKSHQQVSIFLCIISLFVSMF